MRCRFIASNVIIHSMKNIDLLWYLLAWNSCYMGAYVYVRVDVKQQPAACGHHTMSPPIWRAEVCIWVRFSRCELQASDRPPRLSSPPSPLIWLGHCLSVPVIAFACCCVFKNSLGPRCPPLLISQLPRGALGITSRHDNPAHVVEPCYTHWLCIFSPG